ncbi:hypothetical protein TWF217_003658 [Orbilia oligospora]|nr:hypothetical protein TWF128_007643 [Orbilia oligospora]KAF3263222.1 hypothetical protein TWF217_003658 [Orbilia oligospora]
MSSRKTLSRCFEIAQKRFKDEIAKPLLTKDPKHREAIERFLFGMEIAALEKTCKDLSNKAEDKANNNAAKLWTTLDQLKGAADVFMEFAPESISIVWFGISSLITVGNARVQTKLLICGTCDSIANIIGDCVRWEARMHLSQNSEALPQFDVWDSEMPNLIFSILDFLWGARPHLDDSRIKRIGSSIKDLFTKELQQKVDSLLEQYADIVKLAQAHFEESVFQESLKTGLKLDQILSDMREYVSIGADIIDAIQKDALEVELNRQQSKLTHPVSYKDHFIALNDRVDRIIRDRGGRLIAGWLFGEDAYNDWKSKVETHFLCLKGPRGHGKSAAMMSAHREIISTTDSTLPPVICHFFFKKGDQDMQNARTCVESVLYQLLSSNELHSSIPALISAVEALNPSFGTSGLGGGGATASFMTNIASICAAIRKIGEAIPNRLYIMIDALDECHDRQDRDLLQELEGLVKNQTDGIRVIISARDSIDIVNELLGPKNGRSSTRDAVDSLPTYIKVIEITSEKNSRDLEDYLKHDVSSLLRRRIDPQLKDYFDLELSRIVKIIKEKAKGDFTLARMIIANLQQPSKESLEKKVQRLPAAIGAIYMSSIEALSPDEQEFIVSALKWVVWSVSGITVIEISDHYRELYQRNRDTDLRHYGETEQIDQNPIFSKIRQLIKKNPYQDPEIKDIIYHLENAGRDFFKFDRNTGIVGVDISIREWIQEDTKLSKAISATQEARGFNRYREGGNTVFKFTLTPSFVQYGDSLSELFNRKEAHMSIALMRALNNESFQNEHMHRPNFLEYARDIAEGETQLDTQLEYFKQLRNWRGHDDFESIMLWLGGESYGAEDETSKPAEGTADEIPNTQSENLEGMNDDTPRPRRYEIDHWHDHIRSLQAWWSDESIEDSWWSDLLTELLIFTRPENWYRWRAAVSEDSPLNLIFEHPIHTACRLGLHLLVDLLLNDSSIKTKTEETHPRQASTVEALKALKVLSFSLRDDDFSMASLAFIGAMDNEQLVDFLSLEFVMDRLAWKQRMFNLEKVIAALDPELRVTWLAYQKCNIPSIAADKFEFLQRLASRTGRLGPWHPGLVEDINHCLEGLSHDKVRAADKLRLLIAAKPRLNPNIERYCDISSPSFATPLFMSAFYPETTRCLIMHGANVNPQVLESDAFDRARYFFDSELDDAYEDDLTIPNSVWSFKPRMPPLLAILQNLSEQNDPSEEILQRYLESAKMLIAEGARLDVEGEGGSTVLHLAARIRNLKLFKLLCVSWEWDVHKGDNFGWTPLHYLFKDTPPKEPSRIKETLGICEVILKMKGQGRLVVDLVDAEDSNSETPLAFAVRARFKEAVDALIELGANVHDEDRDGGNCFDHLAFESDGTDPETEVAIANTLFEAGVDSTKRTKGRYPLTYAIMRQKTHLVEVFLPKYSEKGKQYPHNNPLLGRDGYSWETWAHLLIEGDPNWSRGLTVRSGHPDPETSMQLLKQLMALVSEHTDVTEYFGRTDCRNWNALRRVIRFYDFEFTKFITAINPDIKPRDPNGLNVLDYWCKMLYDDFAKDEIGEEELETLEKGKEILYHLIEVNMQESPPFSFLETSMFKSEPPMKVENMFDLKRIFDRFRHPYRDEHGWTIYDVLLCNGRSDLIQYLPAESCPSEPDEFSKPSKLGHNRTQSLTISEDGLEFFASASVGWWNYERLCATVLSDNPVPPIDKMFYFEVQIPKVVPGWWKNWGGVPIQWEIGFQTLFLDKNITYNTNGSVLRGWRVAKWPFKPNRQEVDPEAETESTYCLPLEPPKVIGSGINPITGTVFFTVDGIVLPATFKVPHQRYFPSWSFEYAPQRGRVNFGGDPFIFTKANDPAWLLDGSIDIDNVSPCLKFTNDEMDEEHILRLDSSLDFHQPDEYNGEDF